MPTTVLDVEQHLLLLELEAPFDKRDVQLARRRMAKRWHPDVAPAGRQFEHERHLKAINEAADQLERLAEGSRGGKVSKNAVKASAAAARREREEAGRRAYEAEQRARAAAKDKAEHDPFGARVPDHSVVHRYARCVSYPEWGVGTVAGIYFTNEEDSGEEVQQWARVKFAHGIRTVPAGSLKFVDFSKPDPAEERVERFLVAAQRAMAEGEYELAAQRLIYARDAEPRNVAVLRLMTLAFWQAGKLDAAARAVRDWARVDGSSRRPTASRRASTKTSARSISRRRRLTARRSAGRATRAHGSGSAGCGCTLLDREGALEALRRASKLGAGGEVPALIAQALALEPRQVSQSA